MSDFIVSAHALERLEERFPDLAHDDELVQAHLVRTEVFDAMDSGRTSKVVPLELASWRIENEVARDKGSFYAWTEGKVRGYLVKRSGDDMVVVTALGGHPREEALRKRVIH
jgi:hypothetical protein